MRRGWERGICDGWHLVFSRVSVFRRGEGRLIQAEGVNLWGVCPREVLWEIGSVVEKQKWEKKAEAVEKKGGRIQMDHPLLKNWGVINASLKKKAGNRRCPRGEKEGLKNNLLAHSLKSDVSLLKGLSRKKTHSKHRWLESNKKKG